MSDKSTTRPSAKKPVIAKAAIREENGRSARNRFVVRGSVGLMKALGIPEDRICTTITNPRTGKPVAPMTLARAFAAELESGATEVYTLVGNFIICAILGKKPALGDAIKSEQVRMTAAIFYAKTKMGWKETVVNEQANKDDKPFLVDDARQRLIDEIDRIRARKEQKGE